MMKKIYFAAFLSMSAVAACDVAEESDLSVDEEKVCLGVSLPSDVTKVTGTSSEGAVNDLQVFVFDDSGNLESYGHSASSALTLECYPGTKDIVALVNAPSLSGLSKYSELIQKTSVLSDNAVSSLVMEGKTNVKVSSSTTVTVPVSRLAAKVTLTKIVNAMELEYHRKMTFALTSVYMINVAGDKKYLTDSAPSQWYNKMKYEAGSPSFLWQTLNGKVLGYNGSYDEESYFYCYPNHTADDYNDGAWQPRHTRLVVEATLGGTTYYYPVTLPEVDQNTAYEISLTVTRPGSDSPDKPVDSHSAEFTVKVVDWIDGADIDEVI